MDADAKRSGVGGRLNADTCGQGGGGLVWMTPKQVDTFCNVGQYQIQMKQLLVFTLG